MFAVRTECEMTGGTSAYQVWGAGPIPVRGSFDILARRGSAAHCAAHMAGT